MMSRSNDFDPGHWYLPNDEFPGFLHVPAGFGWRSHCGNEQGR